jgi:hypothetical protein
MREGVTFTARGIHKISSPNTTNKSKTTSTWLQILAFSNPHYTITNIKM